MESYCKTFMKMGDRYSSYMFEKEGWISFLRDNPIEYMASQRSIDVSHIKSMVEYQEKNYRERKEYFFPYPVCVGMLNKKYYIIDGQHRLAVVKLLPHNYTITVTLIKIQNMDELNDQLKLINTNKPYVQIGNSHIKNIESHLLSNYSAFIKKSEKPRAPSFNPNSVVKILNTMSFIDESFIISLDAFNTYIKENYDDMKIPRVKYELCLEKAGDGIPFFAGCMPNNSWISALAINIELNKPFSEIDYKVYPFSTTRCKIAKKLKKNLWEKYHGKNDRVGPCYVCSEDLDFAEFECGHVLSVHLGGKNTMDNLRCVCKTCNNDMGIQNLEEYKEQHFHLL